MLKVLAAQSGQLLNVSALSRETNISQPTLYKYISLLEETFIIKRVTPFSHSPSVEISKNPKIFFLDSGLQSLLWLGDFQSTLLGNILETNIFSELVKLYGRGNINFWRTKSGQEVDFVITTNNQTLPIEVKTTFPPSLPRALKNFLSKYNLSQHRVVALSGTKSLPDYIWPWEI